MKSVTELEDQPLLAPKAKSYVPYVPFILLLNAGIWCAFQCPHRPALALAVASRVFARVSCARL